MTTPERQRNIRHLHFLSNDINLLQRVSERFIERAPIGTTPAKARKYVEPFATEISALRESITDTRRKLLRCGVAVPKEWAKLPIKLAWRRNPKTGILELDPAIVEHWAAISEDIEATIEQLEYAHDQQGDVDHAAKKNEPKQPAWDAATVARNKWIYRQCMKVTPYQTIIIQLGKKPANWEQIGSVNGIKRIANAYAKRNGLPPPPKRQSGRKNMLAT